LKPDNKNKFLRIINNDLALNLFKKYYNDSGKVTTPINAGITLNYNGKLQIPLYYHLILNG